MCKIMIDLLLKYAIEGYFVDKFFIIYNIRIYLVLLYAFIYLVFIEMSCYDRMSFRDLFQFNSVNCNNFTETYSPKFYAQYFIQWPEYQIIVRHPFVEPRSIENSESNQGCNHSNTIVMGYILGKQEGTEEDQHGHVSAVTVATPFRRIGIANKLMNICECISDTQHHCYFVDLFAKKSNSVAQLFYNKLNYVVYRTVLKYYGSSINAFDTEDALDYRKALPRNKFRTSCSLIASKSIIRPDELIFN